MIWHNKDITLADFQSLGKNTMGDHLGIEWIEIGPDFLKASMPVDHRTHQPYGLLHGGASCVLAETIGSVASALVTDSSQYNCVGLEINANHVRGIREGFVFGTASPLHIGATTHVWDIRIRDKHDKLICISRLTVAVMRKKDHR